MLKSGVVGLGAQNTTLLNLVVARKDVVESLFYLLLTYVGKKSEATHINADNRNPLVAHAACSMKECSVAAHAYGKISLEVVALDYRCARNVVVSFRFKINVKILVYRNIGVALVQMVENKFY